MKTTELQKLIDFDACLSMPRYSGGHDEQMKGLFKGSKVLAHWKEDGSGHEHESVIDYADHPDKQTALAHAVVDVACQIYDRKFGGE